MRETIIAAAVQEINKHGLRFTMSDIAAQLHVSKRSLYENFPSKGALIEAVTDKALCWLFAREKEIFQEQAEPLDKIRRLLKLRPYEIEVFQRHVLADLRVMFPEHWKKVELGRRQRGAYIEELLRQSVAAGVLADVNVQLLYLLLQSAWEKVSSEEFLAASSLSYEEAVEQAFEMLLYGAAAKNS